ncbi:hypothetical protein C8F04DRAFT_1081077 [Mycena alexandri]|uniref:Uncharacterized protein n=1 Tax=Mycena alexandri TaxID=1745969 RepID=A0AAD6XAK0_9AGAR|nr:hypothetical protein C8F04DRAFT_1081077 [Mycena alexandri]
MNNTTPLKFPRLISLLLAWAWSLISLAVGINAFVKSNRDKSRIISEVPPPTTISLNTNDVFRAGVVVTVISAIIMVLCTIYIGLLVVDANARSGISTRTLPLQYLSLGFFAIWLFATEIPVSLFVSTRSVKVSAAIGGLELPNSVIQTIERALGTKIAYKDFSYLKLIAILPWFAFLFTVVAAVVSFLASSRADSGNTSNPESKVGPVSSGPKPEATAA